MKKALLIFILILVGSLIFISACAIVKKVIPKHCPSSCDDNNACTTDICNKDSGYLCVNSPITPCNGNGICEQGEYNKSADCPSCDDSNTCTTDQFSYESGKCVHDSIPNCCGNGKCENSETSLSCPADCPTCDDSNKCTVDVLNRDANRCEHKYIYPCCGNNRCEAGETFLGCPTDCPPTRDEEVKACGTNESCVNEIAMKYKDYALCKSAATTSGTDECYMTLAVKNNQSFLCFYTSNDNKQHDCQEAYAISVSRIDLCPTINPNKCIESIAKNTGNVTYCKLMTEQFVRTRDDYVLKCSAVVTSDVVLCKQMQNKWIADECYTDIAVQLKDISLCNAVQLNPDSCRDSVARAIG
ncbi:MAG: hypothetical protein EPN86_00085 [Nanoarchaeota archaeon]|nr:MAG: hypothetical protein EPN86_00085 [Nanoarchaeota archaeon]